MRTDAIYARQSIDKADSISIESQIEYCQYETRGEPYLVFQDKGYSGKNTDRPGFQQMLYQIRIGNIKRVICYKLDRCSRSILDFASLMEELQKYNVEFISCTEKFDTSSPMGRAMLNICIVFAQLERETIQQRVLDAYHSRNKKGFYMGGRIPFGFNLAPYILDGKKTSHYIVNPEEAEILEFMYSVYQNPLTSLADVINALTKSEKVHPRNTNVKWTRSHIGRMLRNPIYVKADQDIYHYFLSCGVTIHNPPDDFIGTNGCYLYSGKKGPDTQAISYHLVLAPHSGIVPSDVWLRCRKKHVNSASQNGKPKNTWLVGKIKCAKCGYALVVQKVSKNKGRTYRYVNCSKAIGTGKICSGLHGLKADQIEKYVMNEILKKTQNIFELFKKTDNKGKSIKKQNFSHIGLNFNCKLWDKISFEDKMSITSLLIDKIQLSESSMIIHWKV